MLHSGMAVRACRVLFSVAFEVLSSTSKRTAGMSVPLGSKRQCSSSSNDRDVVRSFAVEGNIGELQCCYPFGKSMIDLVR